VVRSLQTRNRGHDVAGTDDELQGRRPGPDAADRPRGDAKALGDRDDPRRCGGRDDDAALGFAEE
jgi:hypothetical protein